MKIIINCILGLFLFSLPVIAQEKASPEAEAFFQKAMKEINPKHVSWIKRTANTVNRENISTAGVDSMATSYANLGNIQGADIEALCFFVLMQASKSAQEDLKSVMANVKAINNQKAKLREALNNRQKNQVMTGIQLDSFKLLSARTKALKTGNNPDTVTLARTYSRLKIVPKTEIDNAVDKAKSDLDSMSEMGEMESLRLQMAMDRMSKMMSTLSNILKKISDTQNQIIQNMK